MPTPCALWQAWDQGGWLLWRPFPLWAIPIGQGGVLPRWDLCARRDSWWAAKHTRLIVRPRPGRNSHRWQQPIQESFFLLRRRGHATTLWREDIAGRLR